MKKKKNYIYNIHIIIPRKHTLFILSKFLSKTWFKIASGIMGYILNGLCYN